MPITQEMYKLGLSARRLNDGSDQLNRLIAQIDRLLGQLSVGIDYVHPRPIGEHVTLDREGKRVIEMAYLGYFRVQRGYHLAVKTVKVLESKLAFATETPGEVVPLLQASRRLRYAAVDLMPELVAGLAQNAEDMAGAMDRRCATAEALVRHLEGIAGPAPQAEVETAAQSATNWRKQTVPVGSGRR
jgi:hypothetical protein